MLLPPSLAPASVGGTPTHLATFPNMALSLARKTAQGKAMLPDPGLQSLATIYLF